MTLTAPDLNLLGMELAGDLRRRGFGSQLITASDGRYEGARRVWNGAVDRRPALIAQCATPHDVTLAVEVARDRDLPLAVRGGGHSMTGKSVCDGGVVADLSAMRRVDVDPAARRLKVGGGALLEDLARAGQDFGLAVPGGHISHTGVGGITTGGGLGWYHRQLGLTIDSLRSAQVVTADGEVVECDEERNPDLFWAIRGGGGNFGVVTEFRFEAHPLGPAVLAGMMAFELDRAAEAVVAARDIEDSEPDLQTYQVFALAPPVAPFPEHLHGQPVCIVTVTWAGEIPAGQRAVEPLRRLRPAVDVVGPMPYLAVQFMIDDTAPHGLCSYSRSHWLGQFGEEPLTRMVDAAAELASPYDSIICAQMGGAVAQVPAEATAFAHRDAHSLVWIVSAWDADDGEQQRAWVERTHAAAAPWSQGVYVNALAEGEDGRIGAAYPPATWERLVAVKDRWDPDNLFRLNANVPPTGWTP